LDDSLTCAQYVALADAQKATVFDGSKQAWFGPDGASFLTEREVMDKVCASGTPAGSLHDLYAHTVIGQTDDVSTLDCPTFLHLSAPVAKQWADVLGAYMSNSGYTVPAITNGCTKYPSLKLLKGTQIALQLGDASALAWTTESKLGYKVGTSVKLGALQKAVLAYPGKVAAKLGDSCGFAEGKDAAIPVMTTAVNLTAEKQPVQSNWKLVETGKTALTVTPDVETVFASGATCSTATAATGPFYVGIVWTDGTDGLTVAGTSQSYVILHNYFSPRYPNGAVQDLASLEIHPDAGGSETDPITVVEGQNRRMTLSSQKI
jgi:hypothetical protein